MCFLMDVGPLLVDFLPQHGMAEVAKTADSSSCFIVFVCFYCWAVGWICLLIFDWFLMDIGVGNQSTIHQKSIKKL